MKFKFNFLSTLFLVSIFTCFSNKLTAQTTEKATFHGREIGLQLVGLDDFNFDFLLKKQTGENKYLRLGLAFANVNAQGIGDDGIGNFNIGLNIGQEKRRKLSEKLNLVTGITGLLDFALTTTADNTASSVSTGLGFILGVQYQLNESFYIGAETQPSARFGFFLDDGFENLNFSAGFSSRSVGISLVYRFLKN